MPSLGQISGQTSSALRAAAPALAMRPPAPRIGPRRGVLGGDGQIQPSRVRGEGSSPVSEAAARQVDDQRTLMRGCGLGHGAESVTGIATARPPVSNPRRSAATKSPSSDARWPPRMASCSAARPVRRDYVSLHTRVVKVLPPSTRSASWASALRSSPRPGPWDQSRHVPHVTRASAR